MASSPPALPSPPPPRTRAKGNEYKTAKDLASYDADIAAAFAWAAASPHCNGAVGTAGFCIGGALAFRAALHPACKAAVCWYATDLHKGGLSKQGDDSLARAADIKGELMMIYGRQDPHVPAEGRDKVRSALVAAGTNFQWLEVNGQHAFMRDENSYGRYDAELALSTYGLAIKLFNNRLGGGAPREAASGGSGSSGGAASS